MATSAKTNFPTLQSGLLVDVAVIGAGIVGVTAAYLLKRAGLSVALIEGRCVAKQVTGGTTAKISSAHSLMYTDLSLRLGEQSAKLYGEAQEAALQLIADLVRERNIDCDFERLPCFNYTTSKIKSPLLQREAAVAARLGLPATFVKDAPSAIPVAGALRFDHQAQFHPLKYLLNLLLGFPNARNHIFENTRVLNVEEGAPCRIATDKGELAARDVIVATAMPILDRGRYFALAHPYSAVCLAAPIAPSMKPQGMFVSIDKHNFTVRGHPDHNGDMLILMGPRFRTPNKTEFYYLEAERWARRHFGATETRFRWVNEDYMSVDRLPFIGRLNAANPHIWVATGFGSWGMTGGTLAAMILTDRITGAENPWAALFDSQRRLSVIPALIYAWQNAAVGVKWITGHVSPAEPEPKEEIAPGHAAIIRADKERLGVFRDENGVAHAVTPTCTHMGCALVWNDVAKTWDCPCHGSRFDVDGRVLYGPAVRNLERKPQA
jgi:glycine/D-amino acid oxidase-like deaminating enzyme/nitrite reductase/ring-hydroxylating ferredoxin subunit